MPDLLYIFLVALFGAALFGFVAACGALGARP